MNVNKSLMFFAVFIAVIFLSGCKKEVKTDVAKDTAENISVGAEDSTGGVKSKAEDIRDAILKGNKMKCTIKADSSDGTVESEFYVQGDKYKSTVDTPEGKFYSVFDGKAAYTWTEGKKEGMKFDFSCETLLMTDAPMQEGNVADYNTPSGKSSEEIIEGAAEIECDPVASIDLSIPTDVDFIDQCEMLKNLQDQLKNFTPSQIQQ